MAGPSRGQVRTRQMQLPPINILRQKMAAGSREHRGLQGETCTVWCITEKRTMHQPKKAVVVCASLVLEAGFTVSARALMSVSAVLVAHCSQLVYLVLCAR